MRYYIYNLAQGLEPNMFSKPESYCYKNEQDKETSGQNFNEWSVSLQDGTDDAALTWK